MWFGWALLGMWAGFLVGLMVGGMLYGLDDGPHLLRRSDVAHGTHPFKTKPILITPHNEAMFWLQVDEGDGTGCWLWTGTKNARNYGTIRTVYAHRYSYTLAYGPIPQGLVIDHLCRNPPCVRPDHLEAVTNEENMARMRAYQSGRWGAPPDGYTPPAIDQSRARLRIRRFQRALERMREEEARRLLMYAEEARRLLMYEAKQVRRSR